MRGSLRVACHNDGHRLSRPRTVPSVWRTKCPANVPRVILYQCTPLSPTSRLFKKKDAHDEPCTERGTPTRRRPRPLPTARARDRAMRGALPARARLASDPGDVHRLSPATSPRIGEAEDPRCVSQPGRAGPGENAHLPIAPMGTPAHAIDDRLRFAASRFKIQCVHSAVRASPSQGRRARRLRREQRGARRSATPS